MILELALGWILPALAAPFLQGSARPRLARRVALAVACVVLAWTAWLVARAATSEIAEAHLGGLVLVAGGARAVLASVIALIAVGALAFAPRRSIDGKAAAAVLAAEAGALVAVCSRGSSLVLVGWLVSAWPLLSRAHDRAATRLARATVGLSIVLAMMAMAGVPWASWAWALAVLARLGVPPFHSFAIAGLSRAPTSGSVLAIVSPLPLVVLALELTPSSALSNALLGIGAVGAVYAGLVAMVQNELRRALAYVHVSIVSTIVASIGSGTGEGLTGGLLAGASATLAVAGLLFIAGAVEARTGGGDMRRLGGLYDRVPLAAAGFLLFAFTAVGFPGTIGFLSEDLVVQGLAPSHPAVAVVVLVVAAVNGITLFRCFKRTFLGPPREGAEPVGELVPRERAAGLAWALVVLVGGFVPAPLVAIQRSVEQIVPDHVDEHVSERPESR